MRTGGRLPQASIILLSVSAILVGCTGGEAIKVQRTRTTTDSAPTPDTNAFDVLQASMQQMELDLTSARVEFDWHIQRDGFDIKGGGELTFRTPKELYLLETYEGHGDVPSNFSEQNQSELLMLNELVYVKSPALGEGWTVFTRRQFGTDWDALSRVLSAHSPVNYRTLVNSLGSTVHFAGSEGLDGATYDVYRGSVDVGDLTDALTDTYGSQGQTMFGGRFSGLVPLDIWLDPTTKFVHKLEATGKFQYLGSSTDITLTVTFSDENQEVEIPDPPLDAKSIDDLTG